MPVFVRASGRARSYIRGGPKRRTKAHNLISKTYDVRPKYDIKSKMTYHERDVQMRKRRKRIYGLISRMKY